MLSSETMISRKAVRQRKKSEPVTKRSKFYISVIVISTVAISYLHYTLAPVWPLQSIPMDLYYLPVLVAALAFGLRGAIITYIVVVFLYLPYILIVWHLKSTFLAQGKRTH